MSEKQSVPVLILAGGLGTRFAEETHLKPKPMIEIGGEPILVHIMKWYFNHGFENFYICAGYKHQYIKQYFSSREPIRPWKLSVLNTGEDCMTGGRIAKAFDLISQSQTFQDFAVTYGDGLTNANLSREYQYHLDHGALGTILAVKPEPRWGVLDIRATGEVSEFVEKSKSLQPYVNGGFFFFKKGFRQYLDPSPFCVLEKKPLTLLSERCELYAHKHNGFWHAMDTLRDKTYLQSLIDDRKAPWIL